MKRFKKMMAIAIVAVMTMMYAVPTAFAANGAQTLDSFVEVTGLDAGDEVNFYKVIEWDQNSGWKLTSDFASLVTSGVSDGTVVGWKSPADPDTIKSDVLKYIAGINGTETKGRINSELAAKIAALKPDTAANTMTVAEGGSSVKWQEVKDGDTVTTPAPEAGLYMALVTPKTAGVMYNPIFVACDYESEDLAGYSKIQSAVLDPNVSYSDQAMAKKTQIDVKKTIEQDEVKVTEGQDGNTTSGSTTDLSSGGDTEGTTATSVDSGEVAKFKVETTIPEYNELYTRAAFDVTDTLTGLALKIDADHPFTVEAKINDVWTTISAANGLGGPSVTGTDTQYTNTAADKGTSYAISFQSKYILSLTAATPIRITYYATVTDAATKVINPTDNTVKVEFSNNPNNTSDKGTVKDRTNQYSFSIDASINGKEGKTSSELIKIGLDADGYPLTETKTYDNGETNIPALQGATFVLLTNNSKIDDLLGKNKAALEALTGDAANTIYSNANGKAIVDSSDVGKLTFNGLDAGTYYLVETKAPDGFIRDTNVYTITITPTYEAETVKEKIGEIDVTYEAQTLKDYTVTVAGGGNTVTSTYEPKKGENNTAASMDFTNISNHIENDADYDVKADQSTLLRNTQGHELPSTGGVGTTLFYLIGAILVIGAGIVLVTRRRVDNAE